MERHKSILVPRGSLICLLCGAALRASPPAVTKLRSSGDAHARRPSPPNSGGPAGVAGFHWPTEDAVRASVLPRFFCRITEENASEKSWGREAGNERRAVGQQCCT